MLIIKLNKKKKILWVVFGIIILLVVAYIFFEFLSTKEKKYSITAIKKLEDNCKIEYRIKVKNHIPEKK